jgi:chromosome segregation ATPase
MNSEKIRIEDKWLNSQQYIAKLEDDVTQCRAHLELYQIRIDEEKEEIDKLKVKIRLFVSKLIV